MVEIWMPVEGLRYHQKETSVQNRASFPGQKVPPDRLIKSVATASLMSFLKDPVPLAVLGSSLLCFFLVSFFPHPTEMQIHSDTLPRGSKHTGPLGFRGASHAFCPCGKDVPSEVYGAGVTLGHPSQVAVCSCQLECLDYCVLSR